MHPLFPSKLQPTTRVAKLGGLIITTKTEQEGNVEGLLKSTRER